MKINIDYDRCYGCGACANICPKKAITMDKDSLGFSIPTINDDLCIECRLCEKVCPYKNQPKNKEEFVSQSYICINKDKTYYQESRSGSVFPLLCKYIIEQKHGVVYGATINNDLEVVHASADTLDDCRKFYGSKYAESYIDQSVLTDLIQNLKDGKTVLFSGTGCQCYGIKLLAKTLNLDQNLYLVSVLCFGILSPDVYSQFIKLLREQYGNITDFKFRDKQKGWDSHFESYLVNGKKHYSNKLASIYNLSGLKKTSCFSCDFACQHQYSDITLADAWALTKYPQYNKKDGASLVLVNTGMRGGTLFKEVSPMLNYSPVSLDDVLNKHRRPNLFGPLKMSNEQKVLRETYQNNHDVSSVLKVTYKKWRKMVLKDKIGIIRHNLLKKVGLRHD